MPVFKIHRLRNHAQEGFRWAAHTSGLARVNPKDYRASGEIEAPSVYSAWARLREAGTPLRVGDLLETESGQLNICKYVGFEEARWIEPEPGPENPPAGPG